MNSNLPVLNVDCISKSAKSAPQPLSLLHLLLLLLLFLLLSTKGVREENKKRVERQYTQGCNKRDIFQKNVLRRTKIKLINKQENNDQIKNKNKLLYACMHPHVTIFVCCICLWLFVPVSQCVNCFCFYGNVCLFCFFTIGYVCVAYGCNNNNNKIYT